MKDCIAMEKYQHLAFHIYGIRFSDIILYTFIKTIILPFILSRCLINLTINNHVIIIIMTLCVYVYFCVCVFSSQVLGFLDCKIITS